MAKQRKTVEAVAYLRTSSSTNIGPAKDSDKRPDVVAIAKELSARGMSLRKISAALAQRGHLTGGGRPYVASAVQAMVWERLS
jgi:hypothetical protein